MAAGVDRSNVAFDDAVGDSAGGMDEGQSLHSVTGVAGPVLLAATVPDLARGDVLAGRYQIEAVIGSGGSGRVLRAFDRVTRSPVALKILRSEFAADPVWTERFSRELRVGRQIQHPNVCRVYDIGEADGHRFLSMELATGGTLRSQMEPGAGPRSVDDRIADARAIIQGVAALHAAGIVHRDLKPENILRADDGRLVVSDFGLATDPSAGPATTVMIGTPRYMAPEVVMGDPATARSDVWALGVVMHEILSGQRPDRSVIKRRRRVYTPPEVGSPRERRLVELCARCSDEDPQARPANAVELRREFEAVVSGRRLGNRALKRQLAWGAVALASVAALGVIRDRWTSNAIASSPQGVMTAAASGSPAPTGTAADWAAQSNEFASYPAAIHCFSLVDRGKRIRVIWGNPRRAEDIEIEGGKRITAELRRETFASGCPQQSPDGKRLVFEQVDETGSHILLSNLPDGRDAKRVVRGESPTWLPNSEEFLFELDPRHAGMFSIPTGQMTVVGDQIPGARQIAGVAVDPLGKHVALRFVSDTMQTLLMVHALPSLEFKRSMVAPFSLSKLEFSRGGDEVRFAAEGPAGSAQMLAWSWHADTLRNIGAVAGQDVRGTLQTETSAFVVARRLARDLWAQSATGAKRITSDGESDNGSISETGDVLIQRHQSDGSYIIVLRERGGAERIASDGPMDTTPFFFPGGHEWLYSSVRTRGIKRCRRSTFECTVVHSDPLMPLWPVVAPSGKKFAYVTTMNQPRLRMRSLDGDPSVRDLGAASIGCAPVWTTDDRIWVMQEKGSGPETWAEIDANTGTRTGNTEALPTVGTSDLKCRLPPGLLANVPSAHVTFEQREHSVILQTKRPLL